MATCLRHDETVKLPEHLIRLPGGDWTAWRCVALRGAGFPASEVLKLSVPECAAAADTVLEFEAAATRAREKALALVWDELKSLLREQREGRNERATLNKIIRELKMGSPARLPPRTGQVGDALEAVCVAHRNLEAARTEYRQAFKRAADSTSAEIHKIASDEHFREAVIWQNRRAVGGSIQALLRMGKNTSRNADRRRREAVVASYLQRYCVKNDTIGFFGPVGWARFVDAHAQFTSRPGPQLLAQRTVYFESWCIDALAAALAKNSALLPWAAPRRMPFVYLDGTTLYSRFEKPAPVSEQVAAVLRSCDGEHTASELAARLVQTTGLGFEGTADVFRLLELLCARGLISWTIEVPLELHPERTLRRILERIDDEELRAEALRPLNELEAGRRAVAAAAGDAEKLDHALADFENTFTRLTGEAPTRSEGKMYAARGLVYEDCRRDIDLDLGEELLSSLGPPLSLLLTSARWLTVEVAAFYRRVFKDIYTDLARKAGSPQVDFVNFWYAILPILFDERRAPVAGVVEQFRKRWADILALPANGSNRLYYSCAKLQPFVLTAFDAPAPGWTAARYHSPDLMITATDQQAVRRGDYQIVMRELHAASNTLRGNVFVAQHPSPDELLGFFDRDLPETRVVPVTPKKWPELTARTAPRMVTPRDYFLLVTNDSFGVPAARSLGIGGLVLVETEAGLFVQSRDGRLRFDVIEVFGDVLSTQVVDIFNIAPVERHTPRITFDRMVVSRESWRISSADAEFAFEKSEDERFLAARGWARANRVPRFVFVKAPIEPKPFYVDFNSFVYVDIFAKTLRRTFEEGAPDATVNVSEMLPHPGQFWLQDAEAHVYTSEFRMVAVDQSLTASGFAPKV